MLWYKSWFDTRWRFLIGFAVCLLSACSTIYSYVQLQPLLPALSDAAIPKGGALTAAIAEALELQKTSRGFVWSQWFNQNLSMLGLLFAGALGSGSPFVHGGRGALFTLALPAPRSHWLGARASLGMLQLLALTVVPSVALALLSATLTEPYGFGEALVHGLCAFVVATMFFGLALFLSTVFNDLWRPLLLTVLTGMVIGLAELSLKTSAGPFATMAAESYFRDGAIPWVGLALSLALAAALFYAAVAQVARRDF